MSLRLSTKATPQINSKLYEAANRLVKQSSFTNRGLATAMAAASSSNVLTKDSLGGKFLPYHKVIYGMHRVNSGELSPRQS